MCYTTATIYHPMLREFLFIQKNMPTAMPCNDFWGESPMDYRKFTPENITNPIVMTTSLHNQMVRSIKNK